MEPVFFIHLLQYSYSTTNVNCNFFFFFIYYLKLITNAKGKWFIMGDFIYFKSKKKPKQPKPQNI